LNDLSGSTTPESEGKEDSGEGIQKSNAASAKIPIIAGNERELVVTRGRSDQHIRLSARLTLQLELAP